MNQISKQGLINFTQRVIQEFNKGELPYIIHLSGGNEEPLITLFSEIQENDYVFSTHRSHYHYLLKGGTEEILLNKISNGDSMFIFDKNLNFLSSSILAGTTGIAAGVALGIKLNNEKNHVWCFLGDGAEDEGHFYEAVRYVDNMDLPCTFIIEDNNRSVDSTRQDRCSINTITWPKCVRRYHYIQTTPHCGTGIKSKITFNNTIIERYKNDIK
jgi:pyruvate dehydrogenase E1 component alpha subunit